MGILYLQMSAANVLPLGVDHDDLWLCAGEHQRQDLAAQDAELASACCAKVFREKGAKTDRPELAKLIRRLDRGDVLMVAPRSARALNP
jgi:hypothetical protein